MRRIWATRVGSPGIQLPITIRPPGFTTRTISAAVSWGRGANIAPKMLTRRSTVSSLTDPRFDASPSSNVHVERPCAVARAVPAATRLRAMSMPRTVAPR